MGLFDRKSKFSDIYDEEKKKRINQHIEWVEETFNNHKPTSEYFANKAKKGKTDATVFSASSSHGYSQIGTHRVRMWAEHPIIVKGDNTVETSCKHVFKLMEQLNKQNNWNLKLVDKCEAKVGFSYINVEF